MRYLILLLLMSATATGQIKNSESQDLPHVNLLTNGGFENKTSKWTASGGTLTITTADVYSGKNAATWNPSADSETLKPAAVTPSGGLQGKACLAEFRFKVTTGSVGDYAAKITDGAAADLTAALDLAVSSSWQTFQAGFLCPTSGNMQLVLTAVNGSTAGDIIVDGAWLGSDYRIGESAGGRILSTERKFLGGDVTSDADTDLADINFSNLVVGDTYRVTVQAYLETAADDYVAIFATHNGSALIALKTNTSGAAGTEVHLDTNSLVFTATDTSITWSGESTSASSLIRGNGTQAETWVQLEHISTPQESVTLETQGWMVEAVVYGASVSLPTADSTFATRSNSGLQIYPTAGDSNIRIPCTGGNVATGTTCSSGDEQVGIEVDIPTVGKYQVCFRAPNTQVMGAAESAYTAVKLAVTEVNSDTIVQDGDSRGMNRLETTNPSKAIQDLDVCEVFDFASAGTKTIKVFTAHNHAGTPDFNNLTIDNSSGIDGDRRATFTIIPLTQNFPQAVALTGAVLETGDQTISDNKTFANPIISTSSVPLNVSAATPISMGKNNVIALKLVEKTGGGSESPQTTCAATGNCGCVGAVRKTFDTVQTCTTATTSEYNALCLCDDL